MRVLDDSPAPADKPVPHPGAGAEVDLVGRKALVCPVRHHLVVLTDVELDQAPDAGGGVQHVEEEPVMFQ